MTTEFRIDTLAQISALKADKRKENGGGEKVLTLDVKFEGHVPCETIAMIVGSEHAREVRDAFFEEDEHGEQTRPRFLNLDQIKVHNDTAFDQCVAHFGKWKVGHVKVHKFSFALTHLGVMHLSFMVSVFLPPTGLLPYLAELIDEEVHVMIDEQQQSLDLEGEDEREAVNA